jgi:hypothetical protein
LVAGGTNRKGGRKRKGRIGICRLKGNRLTAVCWMERRGLTNIANALLPSVTKDAILQHLKNENGITS